MKSGAKSFWSLGINLLYKEASLLAKILEDPMDFDAQCNIDLTKKNGFFRKKMV